MGALSLHYEALSVEASKQTTADEIVSCIVERLGLPGDSYELAEVAGECKERRLAPEERPVSVMLLWPMHLERDFHRFYLRESQQEFPWLLESYGLDPNILRDFIPFLLQPENREYPDLCQLPGESSYDRRHIQHFNGMMNHATYFFFYLETIPLKLLFIVLVFSFRSQRINPSREFTATF